MRVLSIGGVCFIYNFFYFFLPDPIVVLLPCFLPTVWAIPAWADSVLCVDIDAYWGRRQLPEGQSDYVNLIPLPEGHPKEMQWQWHGAGINKEQTGLFCVPSNAKKVLKVDTITKTTSFIDIEYDEDKYVDFSLDCTNKWYGGITGDDNAVYCSK
jgi:hypothetical protein